MLWAGKRLKPGYLEGVFRSSKLILGEYLRSMNARTLSYNACWHFWARFAFFFFTSRELGLRQEDFDLAEIKINSDADTLYRAYSSIHDPLQIKATVQSCNNISVSLVGSNTFFFISGPKEPS